VSRREAAEEEIKQFEKDVKLLTSKGMTPNGIGDEIPKVGGANFSGYVKKRNTITAAFLTKFYNVWRDRLNDIKNKDFPANEPKAGPATEADHRFNQGGTGAGGSASGEETIWESNKILAEACKKLSETNQWLVEKLLKREDPPELPPG
jgi:hypothetical protein